MTLLTRIQSWWRVVDKTAQAKPVGPREQPSSGKLVLKKGKSGREAAEALGVTRRMVYKRLARYRGGGRAAKYDRSSRPHRGLRRLTVSRVANLAAMRRLGPSSPLLTFPLPASFNDD